MELGFVAPFRKQHDWNCDCDCLEVGLVQEVVSLYPHAVDNIVYDLLLSTDLPYFIY